MLRLVLDENFNNDVLRGLLRRNPALDIVRLQDTEMSGAEDPKVLDWAAIHGRVLVTHDLSTITNFAFARLSRGEVMPGVIQVPRNVPILRGIQDLELIAECAEPIDLEGHVLFLPL